MRIGMLTDTYLPLMGGGEVHVLELSRALSRRGHTIRIATPQPATAQPPLVVTSTAKPSTPQPSADSPEDGEFPTLRLPALTGGGWRAMLRLPLVWPQLREFAAGVDVLHAHYSYLMAFVAVLLGRRLRKPVVVTLHGLGTLDSSVKGSLLRRTYRALSLGLAKGIIATSEEMRQVALRFSPDERIRIIPNGVDTARFTPPVDQSLNPAPVVLSMRRLAPKNGAQYLVEAIPLILAAAPQTRFWITGEGKLEAHIRNRVHALDVAHAVEFIGIIPHDQTPDVYRRADVVVFPSSAESTSLACLEALACQRGVVASALAPYRLMLGEEQRGLLVPLFDRETSDYDAPLTLPQERIQALADAVIRLVQDADLRHNLGTAGRAYVIEHFDWSQIAAQTEQVYRLAQRTEPHA